MIPFLDLKAQQARIAPELRRRLDAVLAHCQFILGPEVRSWSSAWPATAAPGTASASARGTDALQIAMMAEGIGRGDAVFLPAFTYTATAEVPAAAGRHAGVRGRGPAHLPDRPGAPGRAHRQRCADRLRPRALIGVDLFGQPAAWPALRAIAAEHGLFTLDDCAQSFGAGLDGRKLGREADATAISFFPSKPLGGYGDGGALLTDSAERAALYRSLRTPRRGRHPLRGAADRHERPAGHAAGGGAAGQAGRVRSRIGRSATASPPSTTAG